MHFEIFWFKKGHFVQTLDEEEFICVGQETVSAFLLFSLDLLDVRGRPCLLITDLTDLEVSQQCIKVVACIVFPKSEFGAFELSDGNTAVLLNIKDDLVIDRESKGALISNQRQPHPIPIIELESSHADDIMEFTVTIAQDHLNMIVCHDSELNQRLLSPLDGKQLVASIVPQKILQQDLEAHLKRRFVRILLFRRACIDQKVYALLEVLGLIVCFLRVVICGD